MADPKLDYSEDAKKDLTNFEALFAKVMDIPDAGRNLYQNWLAGRWKEALANWGFSSEGLLNKQVPKLNEQGQEMWEAVEGSEARKVMTEDPRLAESFEDYLNRLKGSRDLFGGSTDAAGARTTGRRLEQLQAMGGEEQRAALEAITGKTGLGYDALSREAFLNAQEGRFGRRGAQVIAEQAFNPWARGRFQNLTLEPDWDPNQSFLNERLDALRSRYGF